MLLINNLKRISLKILRKHIVALPQCCQEMRYIGIRLHVFPLACLEQCKLAANQLSLQYSNYINKEASTVLCSVKYFFLLLQCSTAFCVLYNRTEQIRGFFICLIIKNPVISPCIRLNFQIFQFFPEEKKWR